MKKIMNLLLIVSSMCLAKSDTRSFFTQQFYDATSGKWGKIESLSGPGSTLTQTRTVRNIISFLIQQLNIATIMDAPCGDFHWMQHVDLSTCRYIGIDVVEKLIENNTARYSTDQCSFRCLNVLESALPCADLIISRDFLVHMSEEDLWRAIANFKASGSKYLLTTTFPGRKNYNIESGDWRPLNLQSAPFNFPEPIAIFAENCTELNAADKSLGLWRLDDIQI